MKRRTLILSAFAAFVGGTLLPSCDEASAGPPAPQPAGAYEDVVVGRPDGTYDIAWRQWSTPTVNLFDDHVRALARKTPGPLASARAGGRAQGE